MAEDHQTYHQEGVDSLDAAIKKHINRFIDAERSMGQKTRTQSRLFLLITLSLIILGLLVTARDAVNQLFGVYNSFVTVIYVIIGLLITGLATLEAKFKLDERSADLRMLATTCRNARLIFEDRLVHITTNSADVDILAKKQELLNDQLKQLIDIHNQATALKINVPLDIVSGDSTRTRNRSGDRDGRIQG